MFTFFCSWFRAHVHGNLRSYNAWSYKSKEQQMAFTCWYLCCLCFVFDSGKWTKISLVVLYCLGDLVYIWLFICLFITVMKFFESHEEKLSKFVALETIMPSSQMGKPFYFERQNGFYWCLEQKLWQLHKKTYLSERFCSGIFANDLPML